MTEDGLPRRHFLEVAGSTALLGTAALAGCSSLPLGGTSGRADPVPAAALGQATNGTAPEVPERLPVEIEASYLDSAAAKARTQLSSVPAPLDADEIPNGAIREDLAGAFGRAETMLEAADSAPSPFEALQSLRRARGEARTVAAAWRAIDDGLTRAQVAERAPEIDDARADFVGRWRYVGDDPVRAAVVHATAETGVRRVARTATVDPGEFDRQSENPVTVGELAGELERARATLDDVAYLYDRYAGSLSDPSDLRPALERSADALVADVEGRRREIPTIDSSDPSKLVDRDLGDTPAAEALGHLYWRVEEPDYPRQEREAGRPAHAVRVAHSALARLRAFASLRETIAGGVSFAVETADDVGEVRAVAVDAIEAARDATATPALSNRDLARLSHRLRNVDDQLEGREESVPPGSLQYEVAEYVIVAEIAEALPPTDEQVAGALRSAVSGRDGSTETPAETRSG